MLSHVLGKAAPFRSEESGREENNAGKESPVGEHPQNGFNHQNASQSHQDYEHGHQRKTARPSHHSHGNSHANSYASRSARTSRTSDTTSVSSEGATTNTFAPKYNFEEVPELEGDDQDPTVQIEQLQSKSSCRLRVWAAQVVLSPPFDTFIAIVIITNSILIGVEQHERSLGHDTSWSISLENLFLLIYIVELVMRFALTGHRAVYDGWIQLDTFLVVISIITSWLVEPFVDGQDQHMVSLIQTSRLARLARTLRLLKKFRELWMLVRGFIHSMATMCYTTLLLTIILYFFAVIGFELITLDKSAEHWRAMEDSAFDHLNLDTILENHFSTLPRTMLSLVQFVCMDSIGAIYRPLIVSNWALAFYFMGVVLVVAIVLMNIITAVMVNGALEQANQDRETRQLAEHRRRRVLMRSLRQMFMRLDEDNSGRIDVAEIRNASEEDKVLLNEFMQGNHASQVDVVDIFHQLDIDGGGSLDIDEFCEGLYEAAISKTPIELKRMDKRIDGIRHQLNSTQLMQESIHDLVNKVLEELHQVRLCVDAGHCDEAQPSEKMSRSGAGELTEECMAERTLQGLMLPRVNSDPQRDRALMSTTQGSCTSSLDLDEAELLTPEQLACLPPKEVGKAKVPRSTGRKRVPNLLCNDLGRSLRSDARQMTSTPSTDHLSVPPGVAEHAGRAERGGAGETTYHRTLSAGSDTTPTVVAVDVDAAPNGFMQSSSYISQLSSLSGGEGVRLSGFSPCQRVSEHCAL